MNPNNTEVIVALQSIWDAADQLLHAVDLAREIASDWETFGAHVKAKLTEIYQPQPDRYWKVEYYVPDVGDNQAVFRCTRKPTEEECLTALETMGIMWGANERNPKLNVIFISEIQVPTINPTEP